MLSSSSNRGRIVMQMQVQLQLPLMHGDDFSDDFISFHEFDDNLLNYSKLEKLVGDIDIEALQGA